MAWYFGDMTAAGAEPDKDGEISEGYGNGGGSKVYRLREGVERFMITDINNPGASAKAQSTVFIMLDSFSTYTQDFNHIPGGSNILYMDGHVEIQALSVGRSDAAQVRRHHRCYWRKCQLTQEVLLLL